MPTSAPKHHPPGWQSRDQRIAAHNRARRADGGIVYDLQRWRKMRKAFIDTHPLCVNFDQCHNVSVICDHIQPHRGDDALMWCWDNLQAMCKPCHDRKTMTDDHR